MPGRPESPPYTRLMRRWVCVIALLFGFAGEGYAWSARPSLPVAIERPSEQQGRSLSTTGRWWGIA
jgi:hypothetical protein